MDTENMKREQLCDAVQNLDIARVRSLLTEDNLSPDFTLNGRTPIYLAAHNGSEEILDLLMQATWDYFRLYYLIGHGNHRQPIHIAASEGHVGFVKKLVAVGVSVNQSSKHTHREMPLWYAVENSQFEMSEYLISVGAVINFNSECLLHHAVRAGNAKICQLLLNMLKSGVEGHFYDNRGCHLLQLAAICGRADVFDVLVTYGINVNGITDFVETVFHWAAKLGHLILIKSLKEYGPNINFKSQDGLTAFHAAVCSNRYEVVNYLIKINADIQANDNQGNSPLYHAVMANSAKLISLLVRSGYNVNAESWLLENQLPSNFLTNQELVAWMLRCARNPRSLKELSSVCTRNYLGTYMTEKVEHLPLPYALKDLVSHKYLE